MSVETVKIFGFGTTTISRFKNDMNWRMKSTGLYPVLYRMLRVSYPSHFTRPTDIFRHIFDKKICPSFIMAVLRTIDDANHYLNFNNLEISRFNIDAIATLSNRVYRTPRDENNNNRWTVHNSILKDLFEDGRASHKSLNKLVELGIIKLAEWPKCQAPKPQAKLPGLEDEKVKNDTTTEDEKKRPEQLNFMEAFTGGPQVTLLDLMTDPKKKD